MLSNIKNFVVNLLTWDFSDPCYEAGNHPVISYQIAIKCYQQFSITNNLKSNVLNSLINANKLYVYQEYENSSFEKSFNYVKNTTSRITNLKNHDFPNQQVFYTHITKLFNSFNDIYYSFNSKCFSVFNFIQPFPLMVSSNNNIPEFHILNKIDHSPQLKEMWQQRGLDISYYLGAKVLSINNQKPFEFLINYSDEFIGSSYDINARLSLSLVRPDFRAKNGINYGGFVKTNIPPNSEYIQFQLKLTKGDITTISVPYLAISPGSFKSKDEFFDKFCKESAHPQFPKLNSLWETTDSIQDNYYDFKWTSLFRGMWVSLKLSKNKTAALKINSFSKENRNHLVREIYKSFYVLYKNTIDKLIIDVSSSTGDDTCISSTILKTLKPGINHLLASDYIQSSFFIPLFNNNKGIFLFRPMFTTISNGSKMNKEFLYTNVYVKRGNRKISNMSPKFTERCLNILSVPFSINLNKIVVVSDSICFGACAHFIAGIQKINVTTVVIKVPTSSAMMASMPSVQTIDYSWFIKKISEINLSPYYYNSYKFPDQIRHFITFREDFYNDYPLQFHNLQPNYEINLNYKMSKYPEERWQYIESNILKISSI